MVKYNFKKIKNWMYLQREGAVWGCGIGVITAVMAKITGFNFAQTLSANQFAIASNAGVTTTELQQVGFVNSLVALVILGIVCGILIDAVYKPKA